MEKRNNVLIVDDDSSNLMELFHMLRSEYNILTAADGTSAVEKANEFLPDLILLDIVMPDMNGFEVLAELKKSEKTKAIPVIFITGIQDESKEREGLAIGAVDYIRKPFDTAVVKLRVGQQIKVINLQRDLENAVAIAEKATKAAQAANKSKSTFLANMSHEIRTPMNAIMGITDILMLNEKLPEDVAEGLDKIYASSEMLLAIINDILDLSKIEAGKLDIVPAEYEVAKMINDTAHLNMMRTGNRPIIFELQIDENTPAKLIGDDLRIKQILNNILSNAFKYTDAGKVMFSVAAESGQGEQDITLVLNVQDTGHGMTKKQLEKLFDEYSRFNLEAKREIEGTGLGLSIVRRLVGRMNGEIHVESEVNKGTLVTIRLPQKMADTGVLGKEATDDLQQFRRSGSAHRKSTKIIRDPMPYGSVLIVDDVETNLYVATGLMKPYRLQIDTAMRGQEAIDKIKGGKAYDVVFMDHMMPEMDGIETTKRLRDSGYATTIIALTANAVVGQSEVFLQNGFDSFISKPIDVLQLDSILNKFIRDKQPPQVIEAARLQYKVEEIKNDTQPAIDPLLLESFIRDAHKAVDLLEGLCQKAGWFENEDDLNKHTIFVHGMKSSLWNIGEKELSESARILEQANRERNIDLVTSSTPKFLKELRALLEKLKSKQGADGTDDGEDGDIESLREKLTAIKDACADYNRKGALGLIADVKSCSKETRAALNNIKEYVSQSEFEEAERVVVEYIANFSGKDGES